MWGGLRTLGFGRTLAELTDDFIVAKAGDFYYGDVIGNAAHILYGAPSSRVRVERSFRGLAAAENFRVGSVTIEKGTAAALHLTHRGYIDGRHFFTNEECWYLGPNREYRGDNLPFTEATTPITYNLAVKGRPLDLKAQIKLDGHGDAAWMTAPEHSATADLRCASGQEMRRRGLTNPITNATAMAILDAVAPVCDSPPGIVVDDVRPAYRILDSLH
jgi:4-hydroxy-tetrahydrodipicolinate reductase